MASEHLMAAPEQSDKERAATSTTGVGPSNRRPARPRVVVPLDGSELSEQALDIAQTLAGLLDGTIELVHVIDHLASGAAAPSAWRQPAQDYLQKVAGRFPATLTTETTVLEGNPVDELLRYLSGATDTIVAMSTHGRSGLQRFLLGSVADAVIRHVAVPVAVVRDAARVSPSLRNVIVPLDGSEYAAGALPIAMTLTRQNRTLGIVRVVDVSHTHENLTLKYGSVFTGADLLNEMMDEDESEARANLEDVALRLRAAGCHTSWEVRVGRPSDEIIRAAETTGTDLIVMATHGLGGVRRWAFGSVTDEVIHHSHIPVLVIPPHSEWAFIPPNSNLAPHATDK